MGHSIDIDEVTQHIRLFCRCAFASSDIVAVATKPFVNFCLLGEANGVVGGCQGFDGFTRIGVLAVFDRRRVMTTCACPLGAVFLGKKGLTTRCTARLPCGFFTKRQLRGWRGVPRKGGKGEGEHNRACAPPNDLFHMDQPLI